MPSKSIYFILKYWVQVIQIYIKYLYLIKFTYEGNLSFPLLVNLLVPCKRSFLNIYLKIYSIYIKKQHVCLVLLVLKRTNLLLICNSSFDENQAYIFLGKYLSKAYVK